MFKYNTSPMQPLTEESESFSDAQTVTSNRPIHELSGQDTAIIARIKRIREIMDTLRLRLTVEKDNLARERLEAATLFMYHPIPVNRDYLFPFPGYYSVPVPYNYGLVEYPWNPATSVQDYESLLGSYNYGSPLNLHANYNLLPKTLSLADASAPNAYKEQLQDVEKMCQEEFNKMQESISGLRKMKLQTKDPSSDDDISNIPDYVQTNKRRHQKYDKSSHKKQQKIHHRDHYKLRQLNYILGDDTTLDEHRNHYYHHYSHVPQRRRYLNSSGVFKGETMEEYSGDTTETSVPLWHLDSPYESDFD